MRTVGTTSGATAVQVVWSSRRGSRQIEHFGSAHDGRELEVLKAAAQQRIAAGQLELGLGLEPHARLGPASLVLYDVSTLYFEADQGDGFREPGFSKERRLEPQITIGLLTGQDGFPLMISAFEGNKAETKTMLPVIEKFMAAHQLPDVTVVADAGMISEANQKAIEAAGLSFILGMKIPDVPYQVAQWRRDRARRTLRGIDEQVAKAAKAVAGLAPVKRNRFIALDGRSRPSTANWRPRPGTWPG
jgi:hypothetical protein